ncbi:MAG: hypothetical protein K0M45_03080 [Candidatus Paracaedibacteraceae bacterium]|nr:hypothetical protein [Candidatus Paracaedibacteraceae bacterium]
MPFRIILTTLLLTTISQSTESGSSPLIRPLKSILKEVPQQQLIDPLSEPRYSFPPDYDNDIHERQINKLIDLSIPFPGLTLEQSWGFYYKSLLEWARIYSQDNKEFFSDYSTPSISFESIDNYYGPLSQLLIQGFMEGSSLRSQTIENCLQSIEIYAKCCFSPSYFKTEYSLNRMGTPDFLDDDIYFNFLEKIYIQLIAIYKPPLSLSKGSKEMSFNFDLTRIQTFIPSQTETEELTLHHTTRESRKQYNVFLQQLCYQRLLGTEASIEEIHNEMYLLDWLYTRCCAYLKWSNTLSQKKIKSKHVLKAMDIYLPFYQKALINLHKQNIAIDSEDFEDKLTIQFNQVLNATLLPKLIENFRKT